jgi:pimeloyl-ACP methyl ester carboxylesterase
MEQKKFLLNGTHIAYLEQTSEAKKIIFFIHGNSCSARMWQKQFNCRELSDYRLIAFDLPGHGASDSLRQEDYNLPHFASLLSIAIKQLSAHKNYVLVGFSFGANIVAEMLLSDINPKGIVLISPTIVGGNYSLQHTAKEGGDTSMLFTDVVPEEIIMKYIREASLSPDDSDFYSLLQDFQSVRSPFRSAILQSAIKGMLNDEICLLKQKSIPLLLIFGNNERLVNQHYLDNAGLPVWKKTIYKLPGGSHFINIDQPEAVNRLLHQYISEVL